MLILLTTKVNTIAYFVNIGGIYLAGNFFIYLEAGKTGKHKNRSDLTKSDQSNCPAFMVSSKPHSGSYRLLIEKWLFF